MIQCTTCGKEFSDDPPLTCDKCGAQLKKPVGTESGALVLSSPREEEAPPPEPSPRPRTDDELRRRRRVPMPVEEDGGKLDPDQLDTISAYGKKQAIVTVIGFGGSGKTFWVNRLRDEMPNRSWRCSEEPEEEIPLSPAGIQLTQLIPPAEAGRSHRPYLVVDCAGESFVQALERQRGTSSLMGSAVRSYLVALGFASAYVLVIPAADLMQYREEEALDATQATRKQQEVLRRVVDGFHKIIAGMVAAGEKMARKGPDDFLKEGLTREELKDVFERSRMKCPQPIYVALAQADRLTVGARNDDWDSDPFLFAAKHGSKLFKAVHDSFDHYRFDFLSAFYGHDGGTRPHYGDPHYGAVEAFKWIHDRVSPRPGMTTPISTRETVEMRKRLDPEFRQAWGAR